MTTAAKLRDAILRCAREANEAEPANVDYRLHSFVAKLSGWMEAMGERDLDAALWKMLETKPARQPAAHPTREEQMGMDWWNALTEERRKHWLSVARSACAADAWNAFRGAESNIAMES